jgi:competence protein ComEC
VLFRSEEEILNETGLKSGQLVYLAKGRKIVLSEGVWIEALYPEVKTYDEYADLMGAGADENDISLILKVHYRGVSVLMTGDINTGGEEKLMEAHDNLKCDFLKAAHHGSKYSSSEGFLAEVSPACAIFQAGKNGYGHPTAEALEKAEAVNAAIYRNDKHGAIGVFIKGNGKFDVMTMIVDK